MVDFPSIAWYNTGTPEGAAPAVANCRTGPLWGKHRQAVESVAGVFFCAFYCCLFSRSSSRRNSSRSLQTLARRSISRSRSRSRSASLACCTSNSAVLGVVISSLLPGRRRVAVVRWAVAGWPWLVSQSSGNFSCRQSPEISSPVPLKGGRGELFLHKISCRFLVEIADLGGL